jgi:hypothetical protein
MKQISLLLLLISTISFVPCLSYAESRLHQDLSIRLDPSEHLLEALVIMTKSGQQTEWPATFRLAPQAIITSFTTDGHSAAFTFEKGELRWSPSGATQEVVLRYAVYYNDTLPQQMVGIEDPSYGITGTIQTDGVFLSGSSTWHPVPIGASGSFRITIKVSREQLGDIQLLTFLTADNAQLAPGYLAACRDYLTLYQELFGPYPYTKFAVVENFFPTGYGLPGWTLLGSTVIRLPFILTTSLPHEIAHAWWGNAVKVDYGSGNWCEGLATYGADYLLKERSNPKEAMEYRLKLLRDYATLVDAASDFPLQDFRSRMGKADQAVGYGKTAMVFHMLRQQLGDKHFWEGLQRIAREDTGRRVSWNELQHRFEEVSDRDLSTFFTQWIDHDGAPRLTLDDVTLERTREGWVVTGVVSQQAPFYQLDLPLRMIDTQGVHDESLQIDGQETRFRLISPNQPRQLIADPDSNLFRRLTAVEIPVTVNALLHGQDAPVVAEQDLTTEQLATNDLLFIGWPRIGTLPVVFPENIGVTRQDFVVDDIIYSDVKDALFLALAKTSEQPGVIGIFVPLSPGAAQDVARKISHYGRYSYLVFADGSNRLKGTWSPQESPLMVMFDQGRQ